MTASPDYEVFELGDVTLQSGSVFSRLKLAYKTYGALDAKKENAILYPTHFGGQHYDAEWLIGPDGVLDPARYFIIIPNLFGNGLSSSPSNSDKGSYQNLTYHDAIAAQHRMLTERFGISKLALVYGWSMGGMQAYHWAACYPEMVERAAVVCGSAKCSPYNYVFLEGVKAALTADPTFHGGRFVAQPTSGFRVMGRVYAGWAMSHRFFREELWREAGYSSLDHYLIGAWDANFARRDANDLLAQIEIWQRGDISRCAQFGGDLDRALGSITAHMLLLPGNSDRYFDKSDNEAELPRLVNARSAAVHPIPSVHGHRAGNPVSNPRDLAFLRSEIEKLLTKKLLTT